MSVNFDQWLSASEAISESQRAAAAWARIQEKPSSIILKRLGTAQTVRVEYSETGGQANSPAGQGVVRSITVFGVKNHPTISDTNIRANDRFVFDGLEYECQDVVKTLGEIQARCKRTA